MSRDDLHFRLRIPGDLKVQIEAAADANRRSMTAEIVARLQESFSAESLPTPEVLRDLIREAVEEALSARDRKSPR